MAVLECACGKKLPLPDVGRTVTCDCSRSYRCMVDIPQLAANVGALRTSVGNLEARLSRLEMKPR